MTETPTPPEPGSFASHPLDVLLRDWRDPDIPTGTGDYLADEHAEHPEANDAIVAAEQAAYRALADLVDAFRAHPDFSYSDAADHVAGMLHDLPDPAPAIPLDPALAFSLAELAALQAGNGDRPIGRRP